MTTSLAVAIYLAAIVAANLAVAALGPSASIAIAFLLIGLDLTLRDGLHDAWSGRYLRTRMAALIATGGILSFLVNVNAGPIALASTVAFVVAASLDAFTYAGLEGLPRLTRINASNVVGAVADSFLFPTLAFGVVLPAIILGQLVAKVAGGFLWSLVLAQKRLAA